MQTCCGHDHKYKNPEDAGRYASRLLLQVLLGMAFVVNSYVAPWIYSDNTAVSDISAVLGALILAVPILWSALKDLLKGNVKMNSLVSLAIFATLAIGEFQEAGVISFFMLISLVIESRSAEGAHAAIEGLVSITPTTARRLNAAGEEEQVRAEDLEEGDIIRILPGDTVPADGEIIKGQTTLNEATITGESVPRDKGPGGSVFASTHNMTGAVQVKVTRAGESTTLGKVRELIMAAEGTKLPFMRAIDGYAGFYTPLVLMVAGLVWFFTRDTDRVIAILVISCPCALILATPTAMVAALSAAARLGILVKHVADLEATSRISAFVFDKTGTLTTGKLAVTRLKPADGIAPSELLAVAAAAEQFSQHPAAQAIVALAKETGLSLEHPENFHEEAGRGISAALGGQPVVCGRDSWLADQGIDMTAYQDADEERNELSVIFVAQAGRCLGWVGMQDTARPEAEKSLEELRELGIRRRMLVTGDRESVAARVADSLSCTEYRAECLPQEKVDCVNEVKGEGFRVAVVGDGVNDAPALAAGDIGIAMGAAGSDIAIHSATIALMNNDLRRIPFLIRLSRSARAVVFQNLGIGIVFIVVGAILSGLGIMNGIVAAIMHNVGSLLVVFNSARLVRSGEELEDDAATDD